MDILLMLKKDKSYFLAQRCFYEIIYELEKKLDEFKIMQDVESETIYDPDKRDSYLIELRDYLISQIDVMVKKLEGESTETNREIIFQAKYIYCVYLDESLLNETWFGRDDWSNYLLEYHEFSTRNAGDEVFRRIDSILKYMSSQNRRLAKLYLLMLGAGFRGKFRGEEYIKLAEYKNELFKFLSGEASYHAEESKIFPQNYKCILPRQRVKFGSILTKYQKKLLYGLLFFFLLSIFIWGKNTSPIQDNANSVANNINKIETLDS